MSNKNRFDALHVFGAVMRWNDKLREWVFPLILNREEYSGRLVLGEWRAMAAVVLSENTPLILVSGGSNTHPETGEQSSRSVELARRIVEMGVPKEKVVPMGKVGASHTLGNVANLTEYLKAHPEIKRVGMLCPRFQMLRAMAMQYRDPFYTGGEIELEWIEVEKTLTDRFPELVEEVKHIYSTPEADECWEKEQQGMKALLTGSYVPQKSA